MNDLDELARAARSRPVSQAPRRWDRQTNKAHQFFGGLLIVVGFGLWVWGTKLRQGAEFELRTGMGTWAWLVLSGVGCFIVGTVWYLAARLSAWWRT